MAISITRRKELRTQIQDHIDVAQEYAGQAAVNGVGSVAHTYASIALAHATIAMALQKQLELNQ